MNARTWLGTFFRLTALAASFVVLAPACGQTGTDVAICPPEDVSEVALDAVSPLGFSAANALANIEGTRVTELRWANGEKTDLTVKSRFAGGTIAFVDSCGVRFLRTPMTVEFSTADGQFAERWSMTAEVFSETGADFTMALFQEDLRGSLELPQEARPPIQVSFRVGDEEFGGVVGWLFSSDECGDAERVAGVIQMAAFGDRQLEMTSEDELLDACGG